MTPDAFIRKWRDATLKERSAAQEHFIDLCRLLGEATPAEADPTGQWFTFEYGATKAGGGNGWADIWRRACFGWEYKGKGKDLQAAFKQLQLYAPALEYPPLLILSDIDSIVIHTAFTGTVPTVRVITLDDLRDPEARQRLKWAFTDPERLRPGQTTAALTESAAGRFGDLAQTLRGRGHDAWSVGHFCIRLLFCLFAEDIGLLPQCLFSRLLDAGQHAPAELETMLSELFGAMATGGRVGIESVDWFNGGLFDSRDTLALERDDIQTLRELARLDWSAIEPSIFGTLFERGLDPDKRSQLGAHYTDRDAIMRIVDPVVLDPLRAEWATRKQRIETAIGRLETARAPATRTKIKREAQTLLVDFLARLERFRALDPACGSGNFLLLALLGLKDLEHQIILEAEALGLPPVYPVVGPENVLGIEINPYAAELARVTVWIGEIQWMRNHGFSLTRNPILRTLDTIQQRDALLAAPPPAPAGSGEDVGTIIAAPESIEAEWPDADVIIGNPPFLGGSKKRGQLGDDYFQALNAVYAERVPGGADLVCYWFEKARAHIAAGHCRAAGLVATNSIRGGANRKVLDRIVESTAIFTAWSDEPWVNDGAAVRVSLVCFGDVGWAKAIAVPNTHAADGHAALCPSYVNTLNGQPVAAIHADLTGQPLDGDGAGVDLTQAVRLPENQEACFRGSAKVGKFEIPGNLARYWLNCPNPNGKPTSDVVRPWANGMDIARRSSDTWIVDFGVATTMNSAALYELPFQHVEEKVKPLRDAGRRENRKRNWWLLGETIPAIRKAFVPLRRYIATPMVAKHRMFVWLDKHILPDQQLIVIARSDDTTFGILHSRFHELWSLRMCTWLGKGNDPRYTPTTTFETFPFPEGMTPADTRRVGAQPCFDSAQHESGRLVEANHADLSPGIAQGAGLPEATPILPDLADPSRLPAAEVIATAAFELNRLREAWLNPPDWVDWVITAEEEQAGFPPRPVAKPGHEADLKQRTLTNLYNSRPAWLALAHERLDRAVAAAYGWDDYSPDTADDEILRRLLALNRVRRHPAPL